MVLLGPRGLNSPRMDGAQLASIAISEHKARVAANALRHQLVGDRPSARSEDGAL